MSRTLLNNLSQENILSWWAIKTNYYLFHCQEPCKAGEVQQASNQSPISRHFTRWGHRTTSSWTRMPWDSQCGTTRSDTVKLNPRSFIGRLLGTPGKCRTFEGPAVWAGTQSQSLRGSSPKLSGVWLGYVTHMHISYIIINVYVYMYVYIYACTYVYVCIYILLCMYIYNSVYIVCTHIYILSYVYIYTDVLYTRYTHIRGN